MAASINIGARSGTRYFPQKGDQDASEAVPVVPANAGTQGGRSLSPLPGPRFRGGDDESGNPPRLYRAVGLMSGTSLDGIDVAIIETDGRDRVIPGPASTFPYPPQFRERLRSVLGGIGPVDDVEEELTRIHAEAVERFLRAHPGQAIDVVGFHGHTILHRPAEHRTCQLGDGALLARRIGIDVVTDFRSADVAAGGEGAPFAPLFHAALAAALPKPIAVLNIGGVANVTWIGEEAKILAFDTGPGNALIDDWVRRHTGASADFNGAHARAGCISTRHVERFLADPFLERPPPK